ncbi:hypothetical protein DUI87_05812 [Hirundo rustica rustica]|uniref:Uncharacterized protein n=1 Tax=Hirundo rustica rustica TaxID=333673 RepID=A0A3M0L0E1_HIRRU|nr:hypothetical protein DUI87_05812 [Hirundo rustica rustica]
MPEQLHRSLLGTEKIVKSKAKRQLRRRKTFLARAALLKFVPDRQISKGPGIRHPETCWTVIRTPLRRIRPRLHTSLLLWKSAAEKFDDAQQSLVPVLQEKEKEKEKEKETNQDEVQPQKQVDPGKDEAAAKPQTKQSIPESDKLLLHRNFLQQTGQT